MDTSLFGLHGAKYFSFNFTDNNALTRLNQVDNYFNKFVQARRLLLPSYLHTPYFLNKCLIDSLHFVLDNSLSQRLSNLNSLHVLFSTALWHDSSYLYVPVLEERFYFSKWSNNFSPLTPYYQTADAANSRMLTFTTLLDVLHKRELLFKKLIYTKNQIIVNTDYSVSYKNNIISDFKT